MKVLAPAANDSDDRGDFFGGRFRRQAEACAVGRDVINTGGSPVAADDEGEVALFDGDLGFGHEVVGRRQAPAASAADGRMVARMIIIIGHCRVEDNTTKEFGAVPFRFLGSAAQVVGKQQVGPILAEEGIVVGAQHGQAAHQSQSEISSFRLLTIEALQH